jgi:energy-coupling factor transporter ATP-binding protein EcfA2
MQLKLDESMTTQGFDITFPLEMTFDSRHAIRFSLDGRQTLTIGSGLFLLVGDNGSGKTTFLNLLALTAGEVGVRRKNSPAGVIAFDGESYRHAGFNAASAADLRQAHFAIFPQNVFFLPLPARDNYRLLNGTGRALRFPARQYPQHLSGGQQQQMLLDMVLDIAKPVWFLDEPVTNLDQHHRRRFWQRLADALQHPPRIVFLIDHAVPPPSTDTHLLAALQVTVVARESGQRFHWGRHRFEIIELKDPQTFVNQQLTQLPEVSSGDRGWM